MNYLGIKVKLKRYINIEIKKNKFQGYIYTHINFHPFIYISLMTL